MTGQELSAGLVQILQSILIQCQYKLTECKFLYIFFKFRECFNIFNIYRHMCGSVLIQKDWLVTAAHCLVMASECHMKLRNPKLYKALAGII